MDAGDNIPPQKQAEDLNWLVRNKFRWLLYFLIMFIFLLGHFFRGMESDRNHSERNKHRLADRVYFSENARFAAAIMKTRAFGALAGMTGKLKKNNRGITWKYPDVFARSSTFREYSDQLVGLWNSCQEIVDEIDEQNHSNRELVPSIRAYYEDETRARFEQLESLLDAIHEETGTKYNAAMDDGSSDMRSILITAGVLMAICFGILGLFHSAFRKYRLVPKEED